jgi:hypothetical protein
MLCAMESLNKSLEEPFQEFLRATIDDAREHARFLNMLSLLEHIGSRKIMLSQMRGTLTHEILKHLAEETRHAVFFKREAERLAGCSVKGYADQETACAAAARGYFGRLDSQLTARLSAAMHPEAPYLWVSLIVELRAVWVYRRYQKALAEVAFPLSLTGVLAEEDRHLSDLGIRLAHIDSGSIEALPSASVGERRLFERLLSALQRAESWRSEGQMFQ